MPGTDVAPYMGAQVLAGVLAALVTTRVLGSGVDITALDLSGMTLNVFIAEFLFTFALGYVVLNTATAKGTDGNPFYGLAIGFTVVTGAFAVGGISGGAFNPAVVAGLIVMGKLAAANAWVHVVANLAGGPSPRSLSRASTRTTGSNGNPKGTGRQYCAAAARDAGHRPDRDRGVHYSDCVKS